MLSRDQLTPARDHTFFSSTLSEKKVNVKTRKMKHAGQQRTDQADSSVKTLLFFLFSWGRCREVASNFSTLPWCPREDSSSATPTGQQVQPDTPAPVTFVTLILGRARIGTRGCVYRTLRCLHLTTRESVDSPN